MAFNNNFDTLSYISESNDSYRYLLQSTRKIDIIVSPLKVDKISFFIAVQCSKSKIISKH